MLHGYENGVIYIGYSVLLRCRQQQQQQWRDYMSSFCVCSCWAQWAVCLQVFHSLLFTLTLCCSRFHAEKSESNKTLFFAAFHFRLFARYDRDFMSNATHPLRGAKKDAILKDSQFSFTVLMSYRFPSLCVLVSIVIVIRFHHFPFTFVHFNTRILCASFIFSRHTAISRELFGVIFVVAALVRRRFDVKTMPFYLSVVDDLPECLEIDALQKMRVCLEIGWF